MSKHAHRDIAVELLEKATVGDSNDRLIAAAHVNAILALVDLLDERLPAPRVDSGPR